MVPRNLLLVSLLLAGCSTGSEPREVEDLVHATLWEVQSADDDPFPEHRAAADVICVQEAVRTEGPEGDEVLDVDTADCPYLAASQPSLAPVFPGDRLSILAWHQALASTEPDAEGHMALVVDGALIWEIAVPIPGSADIYEPVVEMDSEVPEGAQVAVHVHNHGANTWRLGHVRVLPPGEVE